MAIQHGIYINEIDTKSFSIVAADTAIPFIVGTAPVNMTADPENVNKVILCNNLTEFVEAFGTSKDIMKYTLVQAAKVYFTLYGTGPIICVNVLDPKKHTTAEETKELKVEEEKAVLEVEGVLLDKIKVKNKGASTELVLDTDYMLQFNSDGYVEIHMLTAATDLDVTYKALDPSKVTKDEIIGGVDPITFKRKGMELIHESFSKYRKVPGIIHAPGYSHHSDVAAVMETKTKGISGVFQSHAIIDTPHDINYREIPEWKNSKNIVDEDIIATYGLVQLGDDIYYQSLHLGALMSTVDSNEGGVPSESPSNKNYKMDSLVIEEGGKYVKINLDLTQANYLNENGIVTALNFINGWTAWGNYNTSYPSRTDIKDKFIPVKRMFKWAGNTLILSTWQFIDKKFTNVRRDAINLTIGDWLKGMNGEHLYGSKVELREEDNPLTQLQDGVFKWHIDFSPIIPMQAAIYAFEYNLEDLQSYYNG